MILPIVAYGDIVLKKAATPIESNSDQIQELITNMWDTMYNAKGIGLAAPQIGQSLRLFIVDTQQLSKVDENFDTGIKRVFVNATIEEYNEDQSVEEEGCLSIPDIHADVERPTGINIHYLNEHFEPKVERFQGYNARVIQHEYDHIEGVLFTDKINPLKKRLLKRKLEKIRKGKISPAYKMRFPD